MRLAFFEVPRGALERLPQLMLGLALVAAGDTLMIDARLGLGPWDVLHQGLSDRIGLADRHRHHRARLS